MTQSPPVTDATTLSDDEIISSIGAYEYGWHDNGVGTLRTQADAHLGSGFVAR